MKRYFYSIYLLFITASIFGFNALDNFLQYQLSLTYAPIYRYLNDFSFLLFGILLFFTIFFEAKSNLKKFSFFIIHLIFAMINIILPIVLPLFNLQIQYNDKAIILNMILAGFLICLALKNLFHNTTPNKNLR